MDVASSLLLRGCVTWLREMPVKRRRSSRRASLRDAESAVEAEVPSPKKLRRGDVSDEEEASLGEETDAAVLTEMEKVRVEALQRPEAFLQHSSPSAQELALHLRAATKALYDHGVCPTANAVNTPLY